MDYQKVKEFFLSYYPTCSILFVRVNWNGTGGFYHIPLEAQREVFEKMGRDRYIKLPKQGTNPRGVEISKEAMANLIEHPLTKGIDIYWKKEEVKFNPYKRWLDMWMEDE